MTLQNIGQFCIGIVLGQAIFATFAVVGWACGLWCPIIMLDRGEVLDEDR